MTKIAHTSNQCEGLWAWEEDHGRISKWEAAEVVPGTFFIKYVDTDTCKLETAYQMWKMGEGRSTVSYSRYVVDFEAMTQNAKQVVEPAQCAG